MSFKVEKIIDPEDVGSLVTLYKELPSKGVAYQDFNLHNAEKVQIPKKYWNSFKPLVDLKKYVGMEHRSHYFLRYMKGSFTSLHCDDKRTVGKTVVTFLQMKDLIGGDTLFLKKFDSEVKKTKDMYVIDEGSPFEGRYCVPDIARGLTIGDSIVYDQDVRHGMTEIKQGQRIVLVSWFKPL